MTPRHKPFPSADRRVVPPQARSADAAVAAGLAATWATAQLYLAVGLGSVIGGTARWLCSELLARWPGGGFPWGTLFVNVVGSLLIGFYATLTGPDGRWFAGPRQRQFVMAGICGGFTTFSIFSLETIRLLQTGAAETAGLAFGVSVIGWLAAVWVGHALAVRINRLRR